MPTVTKRTYRKKRPLRKKKYVKKKKNHSNAWLKIPTLGMPYNMVTFLQYNSKTMNFNLPQGAPVGSSYWTTNGTCFALGTNSLNPVNLVHATGFIPTPASDNAYFGMPPTASSEGVPVPALGNTFAYSQLSWFANWWTRMRVSHVWVQITIRPVEGATIPGDTPPSVSSRDPFSVSILDAKYIANNNAPELLVIQDLDDLRSTRGCKTYTFSGQRSRPIVIKRRVDVRRLLGVKDLADTGYETQCAISPLLNDMTNPTVRYKTFEFIRISRPNIPASVDLTQDFRFSIQFKVVAKVHFSQLSSNNPTSLVAPAGPANPPVFVPDDPNPEPEAIPPPGGS